MTARQSMILSGGYSPWQAPLAALFSGISAAAQPGGFANFGQGATQGIQNFQQGQAQQQAMDLRRMQIEQAQEEMRRANQEREQEQAKLQLIQQTLAGGPGSPTPGGQSAILGGMNPQQSALFSTYAQVDPENAFQMLAERTFAEPEQPKPTDDQREYELAKSQGYEGTFLDYLMGLKNAGAQNTTVNVNTPKSILAGDEKLLEIGAEGSAQAQEIMPLFDIAEAAAKNFSQSGPMGGAALFLERSKNYLGLPNNASSGEVLQGMQTRLGTLLRVPGSGATSNYEMSLYMQGVPGLLNSQQGNVALAKIGKKLVQKRIENFQRLQAYVAKNGTSVGYQPDDTPALTPEEMQMLLGASSVPDQGIVQELEGEGWQ